MQQPKKNKLPKIVTQTDDFGRKKFTLKQADSQPQNAQQTQQKFIDTGRYTSTLIGRQQKIDTDKYIGIIDGNKKKKKTEVFYCQVCKVGFKCDIAFITHVNSPSHNRKLGMNMRVQAVSKETVAQKLARMAEQKGKSKYQKMMEKRNGKNWQAQIYRQGQNEKKNEKQQKQDQNIIKQQIKKQAKKEEQTRNRQQLRQPEVVKQDHQQSEEQVQQQDQDLKLMQQLGLPTSFSSKNKKY